MRRCPECRTTHKSLKLFGWLVYGEANLMAVDGTESIGAIVPHIVINEVGYKAKAKAACNVCGYSGSLDTFVAVNMCFSTGKEANEQVRLFERSLWVASDIIDDVNQLTAVNLDYPYTILEA